jgi:hypothetical protein
MTHKISYLRTILKSDQEYVHIEYPRLWGIYGSKIDNNNSNTETNSHSFYYSQPFITGVNDYICEYITTYKNETTFYKLTRILYFANPYYTNTLGTEIGTLYTEEEYKNSSILPITSIDYLPNASIYKYSATYIAKQCLPALILSLNIQLVNLEKYINNSLAEYHEIISKSFRSQSVHVSASDYDKQIEELNAKLHELSSQLAIQSKNNEHPDALPIITPKNENCICTTTLVFDIDLPLNIEPTPNSPALNNNKEPIIVEFQDYTCESNTRLKITDDLSNSSDPDEDSSIISEDLKTDITPKLESQTSQEKNDTITSIDNIQTKKLTQEPISASIVNTNFANHISKSTNLKNVKNTNTKKNNKIIRKKRIDCDDFDNILEDSKNNQLITWSYNTCHTIGNTAYRIINHEKNMILTIFFSLNWIIFRLAESHEFIDSQELIHDARSRLRPGAISTYLLLVSANLLALYFSYNYQCQHKKFNHKT